MKLSVKAALGVVSVVSLIFLSEMVFLNRVPEASDTVARYPINKWGEDYRQRERGTAQWFPHLFSGMPSYGAYINTDQGPINTLLRTLRVNKGIRFWIHFVLGGMTVFILLRRRKLSTVAACFGALVYGLTPYLFGLINAGHGAKITAVGYLPLVILGFEYLLTRTTWRGIFYLGVASALQLWSNHPQIVYYTWMLALFMFVWSQLHEVSQRKWSPRMFVARVGVIVGGIVVATLMVADPYVPVLQFQAHSTRGAPSVLDQSRDTERGTGWDYATQWSFHPKETVSFIYPYFYGLQNAPTRDLKSAAYWGYMPFTQSTHYLGLLTILLAILGLTLKKPDSFTLSMTVATAIILVIGFGKYVPVLYWPLFKFAPLFSKFRIPSMIYVLLPLTLGAVAAKGVDIVTALLAEGDKTLIGKLRIRSLAIFGTVIGATILLLILGRPAYDAMGFFVKSGDPGRFQANVLAQLKNVRLEIFQKGMLLALFVSAGGLASLWLGWRRTLKGETVGILLLGLLVVDLWVVDREFLHLKNPGDLRRQFRATPEVEFLRQDKSLFRILPLDDFNTNRYGYFGLSSVGGYRPVKLRTYQDLMDAGGLNNVSILSMLNVKYVITRRDIESEQFRRVFKGNPSVYRNTNVLPRAWMVNQVVSVSNQKASLEETLNSGFDPSTTAVVVDYRGPEPSGSGPYTVEITLFSENEIILETSADGGRLLVLSENYYGPGWKAQVDGIQSRIYQTNHVLRSVYVPPGDHTVTFRYDTALFRVSRLVSRISLAGVLLVMAFIHRAAVVGFLSRLGKKGR